MNTRYIIITFLYLLVIKSSAQFTLLAATHAPTVGTVYYSLYNPALPMLPDQDGPNCQWNFSGIKLNKKNAVVQTYVPPSGNGIFLFPSVTLERDFGGNFGQTEYYKSTLSAFEVLGYSEDTEPLIYKNPYMMYKWPMNYGDTFSDVYVASIVPVTPIYMDSGTVFTSVSGFGSLTLPNGQTYSNVLKMHKIHSSVISYNYLSDTIKTSRKIKQDIYFDASMRYPVMEVYKSDTDSVLSIYVIEPTNVTLAEQRSNEQLLKVPNPANGKINLKFNNQNSNECVAILYNSDAKEVKKIPLGNTSLICAEIGIHDLPSGTYLLKVQSDLNTYVKKIIIN